jgi:hypothetical protein
MPRALRSSVKKSQVKKDTINEVTTCRKSKSSKRSTKKKVASENKESQQNEIWNINSIISNIFAYIELKDLINLNTVCKRWNNLSNPIIHKAIKLQRRRALQNKDHDKRLNKVAKSDKEVEMCIANNSKHAQFIKNLEFNENLQPQRAIQLFETFRFVANLTLKRVVMSQDQFISILVPLTQLQELNLVRLGIKRVVKHKFVTEPAALPSSLTKLTLDRIYLHKNPELFIQTINSHSNLVEFKFIYYNVERFLDPFFKSYPTLKSLKFNFYQGDHTQSLIKVFKSNSQLTSLKLKLSFLNNNLISDINCYLTNLEKFSFIEGHYYNRDKSHITSKFSQPTKIKKFNLSGDLLGECSLNSILLNCPDLEELSLCRYSNFQTPCPTISISLLDSLNIMKLNIICDNYTESSLNSVLAKCYHLKELEIKLPYEWKGCMKTIGSTCYNLEHLMIRPSGKLRGEELDTFRRELYEIEFLTSNSLYKFTLKQITLNQFDIYESKAEYFNNFSKLKFIEYPMQIKPNGSMSNIESNFDKNLWPNYSFDVKVIRYYWGAKLAKLNN